MINKCRSRNWEFPSTLILKRSINMSIYIHLYSLENNSHYLNRYVKFINSRTTTIGYVEAHHILPRSLFVEFINEPTNIIKLSAREHFIAHWLLYKAYPRYYKMKHAFWIMCNGCGHHTYLNQKSKTYETLRLIVSQNMSKRLSVNNPYTAPHIKQKIIDKHGGIGNGSIAIYEKQKKTLIEKYGYDNPFKNPEFIKNIPDRVRKDWQDPEQYELRVANIKKAYANRPILTCPHCGLTSKSASNMSRYHYDNCKLKS